MSLCVNVNTETTDLIACSNTGSARQTPERNKLKLRINFLTRFFIYECSRKQDLTSMKCPKRPIYILGQLHVHVIVGIGTEYSGQGVVYEQSGFLSATHVHFIRRHLNAGIRRGHQCSYFL